MNLNMLLKLGNLICAHADNVKFIYKPRNICSQQKKNIITIIVIILYVYKNVYVCLGKSEYHNSIFPFALGSTFTLPCFISVSLSVEFV